MLKSVESLGVKPHAKVAKAAKIRQQTPFSSALHPSPFSEVVFQWVVAAFFAAFAPLREALLFGLHGYG